MALRGNCPVKPLSTTPFLREKEVAHRSATRVGCSRDKKSLTFFLSSSARSSHLDPKKDMGNFLLFTCLHNFLQMLIQQLTSGDNFGLPPTSSVLENMYMKRKRVPDPTFWAVGLCFWMVRVENCAPNHPNASKQHLWQPKRNDWKQKQFWLPTGIIL